MFFHCCRDYAGYKWEVTLLGLACWVPGVGPKGNVGLGMKGCERTLHIKRQMQLFSYSLCEKHIFDVLYV